MDALILQCTGRGLLQTQTECSGHSARTRTSPVLGPSTMPRAIASPSAYGASGALPTTSASTCMSHAASFFSFFFYRVLRCGFRMKHIDFVLHRCYRFNNLRGSSLQSINQSLIHLITLPIACQQERVSVQHYCCGHHASSHLMSGHYQHYPNSASPVRSGRLQPHYF
jgi:hypothetical protein